MTTEVAVRGEVLESRGDLSTWAENASLVHKIALSLAGTSFVPKSMQGRPDEVTGAILAGRELGLEPMAALRSIDVIDGTPALRAVALRGLVQAQGHQIWVEESTETRAVVRGKRKGEVQVQTSTWNMDRARKAGLAGKKNWVNHPQAMLVARATAECCRLVAADKLIAMPYTAEELADDLTPAVLETATKPAKRTAQRKPLVVLPKAPTVVPYRNGIVAAAETEPGPSVDSIPEPDGLTDGMRKALMATYREIGITDRAKRLEHASRIVGRPLGSANELTHAEAHDLLAALEAEAAHASPPKDEGEPA
jgi:hypothetical protein